MFPGRQRRRMQRIVPNLAEYRHGLLLMLLCSPCSCIRVAHATASAGGYSNEKRGGVVLAALKSTWRCWERWRFSFTSVRKCRGERCDHRCTARMCSIFRSIARHAAGIFYWAGHGGAVRRQCAAHASRCGTVTPQLRPCCGAALLTVTQGSGAAAGIAVLAIGFFNSIMFPVIFR